MRRTNVGPNDPAAQNAGQSQAERIIAKFGSPYRLARAISDARLAQYSPGSGRRKPKAMAATTVYRWTYPVEKSGTGGIIPSREVPWVKLAARREGVVLTESDWYPGRK